jgi:hypothetical protein
LEKKPQISCIMSRFGVKKKPVKKGQIGKKKSPDLGPNLGKLVPSVVAAGMEELRNYRDY